MQENKKNNATHFIEQYRNIDDENDFYFFSEIHEISNLKNFLYITKKLNLKTVCVFLITPKQKP